MQYNYVIFIPDKTKRLEFAREIRVLCKESNTFIPRYEKHFYRVDIGIESVIDEKTLRKIDALIQRRGYVFGKRKSQN
tara:strand:- start:136 stop:369 length:234 start_codon:yes stop_codon:yes gene_type:complete